MIFSTRKVQFDLSNQLLMMGILNLTPDSFADNGKNFAVDSALYSAKEMIEAGVDIIDVGGESTRPGSDPVEAEAERNRVLPVIESLRETFNIPISIDTWKSSVASAAIEAGADIINDISGFQRDPEMKHLAAETKVGCIAMHMRGTPQSMQNFTNYDDLMEEMNLYFTKIIKELNEAGVDNKKICLDPGIGFSKNCAQNLLIIKELSSLSKHGRPVLLGPSKKSFIGQTLKLEDPNDRNWGTAASISCGIMNGARILRVHDVKEMKQVSDMTFAIMNS